MGIEERACGISSGQLKRGGISRCAQEKRLPRRILNAAGLAKPSVEADTSDINAAAIAVEHTILTSKEFHASTSCFINKTFIFCTIH